MDRHTLRRVYWGGIEAVEPKIEGLVRAGVPTGSGGVGAGTVGENQTRCKSWSFLEEASEKPANRNGDVPTWPQAPEPLHKYLLN